MAQLAVGTVAAVVCLLLLVIVPGSLSICVLEGGTDSTCSHSSLLVVSHSQIAEDGYSIIVDDLLNLTTNCSTPNIKRPLAIMEGSTLNTKIIDWNSGKFEIPIPASTGPGQHIISFSYVVNDTMSCCTVNAQMSHELTLKAIDAPVLIHQLVTPTVLQCQLKPESNDTWTEFVKDGMVLGYCGPYTSPIKYQNGMSIYYNTNCTLKIDKFTDEHIGRYWCTVMVPYPDGNGFLKVDSNSLSLNDHTGNSDRDAIIGLSVGIGIAVVLAVILSVALVIAIYYRRRCPG